MRTGIAMVLAFVLCGVAADPALADRHGHHRGRWGYERHERGWYGPRRHFFFSSPDVYYAPPPVVYVPSYPSPGINFVFPLRIH